MVARARGFVHEKGVEGRSVEWYTPPYIFTALACEFDLDPCAGRFGDYVPARRRFRLPEHDGLREEWSGNVWLNPPYGRQTGTWVSRLAAHGNGIALVFARTSTRWFAEVVGQTSALCFLSRRVSFVNGETGTVEGGAGADSVLLAFGAENAERVANSGLGWTLTTWRLPR